MSLKYTYRDAVLRALRRRVDRLRALSSTTLLVYVCRRLNFCNIRRTCFSKITRGYDTASCPVRHVVVTRGIHNGYRVWKVAGALRREKALTIKSQQNRANGHVRFSCYTVCFVQHA